MNNMFLKNFVRFVLLVSLQIFLLNKVNFFGYLNPYIYILFIMLLPFETPGWLLLLFGFVTGLIIDMFANTPGLNAAATVLMAFMRPAVINLVGNRPDYDQSGEPSMRDMGFQWFLPYAIMMVLIHHCALNLIDVFSFREFGQTFLRVIISSSFTLIFIFLAQYMLSVQKER
jgi:rod shape-determining protein MreD